MASSLQRSLKHEYELYVDQEIESYKDSIPRSAILRIGDEAVAILRASEQGGFNELLLCTEVDRIIRRRLLIPSYATWRRRRVRLIAEFRRPERWGIAADAAVVREIPADREAHVLVIGAQEEGTALFLAANGCQVTAVLEDGDIVERVMMAASQVGLASRVNGHVTPIAGWYPAEPLHAVVSTPAAFSHLSAAERTRVIEILKSATLDGGVHLVQTLMAGHVAMSAEELQSQYLGWEISPVRDGMFTARKSAA